MHILILEDEIPAFKKILQYVSDFYEGNFTYEHLKTISDASTTLSKNNNYDLIISDIELLDGNVFSVFETIAKTPPIIFCTAYNKYLIKAFQVNGISYVLKPYSQEELNNALSKYQELVHYVAISNEKLYYNLQQIISKSSFNFKKRFAIKKHSGIKLLEVKDISVIEGYGDFTKIIDIKGEVNILSKSIGTLINDLDPQYFFRVNRSYFININYIEAIKPYSKNRLVVKMKSYSGLIKTSTAVTKEFRKWIDK